MCVENTTATRFFWLSALVVTQSRWRYRDVEKEKGDDIITKQTNAVHVMKWREKESERKVDTLVTLRRFISPFHVLFWYFALERRFTLLPFIQPYIGILRQTYCLSFILSFIVFFSVFSLLPPVFFSLRSRRPKHREEVCSALCMWKELVP